ncbi:MAG: SlyX protein [Halioglobus sp.]
MTDISKMVSDLIEVQNQLAFQEDTMEALNTVLTQQQQEILVLRRQIELLKQRQDEQGTGLDGDQADPATEKPPHY